MKLKVSYLFVVSLLLCYFFSNVTAVKAMNTGFKTTSFSTEEKINFLSNVNISFIKNEPPKESVACFDVNSEGLVAIGQETQGKKIICVYSKYGDFEYGYTFNCFGDFGVEWDNDNLNIYFVRSSAIISVSPNGVVVGAFETQNTHENNLYVNHFIHATKRTVGDEEYSIENGMGILNFFANSYSKVVVRDSVGSENVIYEMDSHPINTVLPFILTICIIFLGGAFVLWNIFKNNYRI